MTMVKESLDAVQQRAGFSRPEVAIVLGSGLGHLRDHLYSASSIPYHEIPHFPVIQVAGHQAELLTGDLFGYRAWLFSGRFHVYQGLSAYEATVPVRLAAAAGCRSLLLTCAVGGIASGFNPGDFMLVKDHLNFSGISPLQGLSPPSFVDLHDCYRHEFHSRLMTVAAEEKRMLHAGVLAYMPGPSYETPAEIAALRTLGASAVGMSSVLEAIMARAVGLEVSTLALITNLAGGGKYTLSHQDVLACAVSASVPFGRLIEALLPRFVSD